MSDYTAHLARDGNRLETACGEPWQGWQAPAALDLAPQKAGYPAPLPPHRPPQHGDRIRQCQACARAATA